MAPTRPDGTGPGRFSSGRWLIVRAVVKCALLDLFQVGSALALAYIVTGLVVTIGVVLVLGPGIDIPHGGSAAEASFRLLVEGAGSLLWVIQLMGIVAYVGMRVPVRVLAVSAQSEVTVRRRVAVVGAVALWVVAALLPGLKLDPVLAVGYLLVPVAFAVAALGGPARPPTARGWRLYLSLALAFIVLFAAQLAAWALQPSVSGDLTRVGLPSSVLGLPDNAIEVDHWVSDRQGRWSGTWVVDDVSGAIPAAIQAVQVEVWPAEVRDGDLQIGDAPVVVARNRDPAGQSFIEWPMPVPRVRELMLVVVIGILPDGRRVILDREPEVRATPPWTGTLAGWWLSRVAPIPAAAGQAQPERLLDMYLDALEREDADAIASMANPRLDASAGIAEVVERYGGLALRDRRIVWVSEPGGRHVTAIVTGTAPDGATHELQVPIARVRGLYYIAFGWVAPDRPVSVPNSPSP